MRQLLAVLILIAAAGTCWAEAGVNRNVVWKRLEAPSREIVLITSDQQRSEKSLAADGWSPVATKLHMVVTGVYRKGDTVMLRVENGAMSNAPAEAGK